LDNLRVDPKVDEQPTLDDTLYGRKKHQRHAAELEAST
jgi:hypothetical protein